MRHTVPIHLVGPGGAGKSTVGLALARRLGVAFIDLDEQFKARAGDISAFLNANGYHAYAERHVRVCLEARAGLQEGAVIALSSGFMTYSPDVRAAYAELRAQIASSPTTFVLLPSLYYEVCVGEIVRRQASRPFRRSAEREEEVIRQRFGQYRQLSATTVETLQPVDAVVEGLLGHLQQTIHSRLQWVANARLTVIVGFTELSSDGGLYNSAAVVRHGTLVGVYRKRHPAIRRSVYRAGKDSPVFHADGVCFGILICYDSTFRGLGAELASLAARVLFIPTNNALPAPTTPADIVAEARTCDVALATENGCWMVRSDVAGVADSLRSEGSSAITSPDRVDGQPVR